MKKLDIVEPASEPTKWVNALTIVEKPNGKLRFCQDAKLLNQAIRCQHYKFPIAEKLSSERHNANFFTKVNSGSGYCQI